MTSPSFEAMRAAARAATDATFGGEVLITYRTGGGYTAPAADPERPAHSKCGIFTEALASGDLSGDRKGSEFQGGTQRVGGEAHIRFSAAVVAELRDLRKGDLITLSDGRKYSVVAVMTEGGGGLTAILAREQAT